MFCSLSSCSLPPDVVFGSLTSRVENDHANRPVGWSCHTGPERGWGWDPTLGLINDLRDHRVTFPAAALSWARALRFVYSFPSDYITITDLGLLLPLRVRKLARRVAAFRSLMNFNSSLGLSDYPKSIIIYCRLTLCLIDWVLICNRVLTVQKFWKLPKHPNFQKLRKRWYEIWFKRW